MEPVFSSCFFLFFCFLFSNPTTKFKIIKDDQASWGRVEQARVSKIERAKDAGELIRDDPSKNGELIRADPSKNGELHPDYESSSRELIRAYQTKNAAFVSKIKRARAAGELITDMIFVKKIYATAVLEAIILRKKRVNRDISQFAT